MTSPSTEPSDDQDQCKCGHGFIVHNHPEADYPCDNCDCVAFIPPNVQSQAFEDVVTQDLYLLAEDSHAAHLWKDDPKGVIHRYREDIMVAHYSEVAKAVVTELTRLLAVTRNNPNEPFWHADELDELLNKAIAKYKEQL